MQRPVYKKLGKEVKKILKIQLKRNNISFAFVTCRAKKLESFIDKIVKKQYKDPMNDNEDFAGVKIVYLYKSDLNKVENLIKDNFVVKKRVDKLEDKGEDTFGYSAIHFIVELKQEVTGSISYAELKGLPCEIQVKTVLQDAWATIDHHLKYKSKYDIPKNLRRIINSLSGTLEAADYIFDNMPRETKESLTSFDKKEINEETLKDYLSWRFPNLPQENGNYSISYILRKLNDEKISTFSELDKLIDDSADYRNNLTEFITKVIMERDQSVYINNALSQVAMALAYKESLKKVIETGTE